MVQDCLKAPRVRVHLHVESLHCFALDFELHDHVLKLLIDPHKKQVNVALFLFHGGARINSFLEALGDQQFHLTK